MNLLFKIYVVRIQTYHTYNTYNVKDYAYFETLDDAIHFAREYRRSAPSNALHDIVEVHYIKSDFAILHKVLKVYNPYEDKL